MAILLEVEELRKSFKEEEILKGVCLKIKENEIVGIIGKSGCGKSTLLKILAGYYKPDKGKIFFNSKEITKEFNLLKKAVGYTTQENSFYEKLSVQENMKYYAELYNVTSKKRINEILGQVGLLEHKKKLAENISGGMKRRLDFAISLIHDPDILILDEPTTGLDPLLVDQFWKIVCEIIKKENKMAIVSSHILSEIKNYCTRVAIMEKGKIAGVLDKEQIKDLEIKFKEMVN